MKLVYITGCLGFMGSHLTRKVLERGWYVRGIDSMTYAAQPKVLEEFKSYDNFSFNEKDINDLEFLYDCDYIINTAAETHVGNSIVKNDQFVKSNVNGVHKILNLLREYRTETQGAPLFIHFSTDEVYGDIKVGSFKETQILCPSNPYSATKAAADMFIHAWHRTYGTRYVIVRPTNNYGVGQYVEKLIPKTVKYLKLGRKIPLHNQGTPVRTWLHAKDTADAILAIIDSNVENEIYNISGNYEDQNISVVKQIIDLVSRGVDYEKHLDLGIVRAGQDVRYSINDSKLKGLGWNPQCNFEDELKEIVEYYCNNFIW